MRRYLIYFPLLFLMVSCEIIEEDISGRAVTTIAPADDAEVPAGDTLFRFGCGRTDLPTGSSEQMQASLARVVPMARNLEIYPGHGD